MRKLMILALLLVSGVTFAQNNTEEKAVCSRFEDGTIKETGMLKGDKLDGQWVKYSKSGDALVVGKYSEGKKVGEWLFLNENTGSIMEVQFENNKVVSTKKYVIDSPTSIISYTR